MRKVLAFTLAAVVVVMFSGCAWESSFPDAGDDDSGTGGDLAPGYPEGPYGTGLDDTIENFQVERVSCQGDTGVGRPWRLGEFLGSRAILVAVHAGWCGFCKQQATTMEADIQEPYGDQGLEIILLMTEDPDYSTNRQTLLDYSCYYRRQYGLSFTMGIDPGGAATGKYSDGLPLNILLDEDMSIRYKFTGLNPDSGALQDNIEGLLRGPAL